MGCIVSVFFPRKAHKVQDVELAQEVILVRSATEAHKNVEVRTESIEASFEEGTEEGNPEHYQTDEEKTDIYDIGQQDDAPTEEDPLLGHVFIKKSVMPWTRNGSKSLPNSSTSTKQNARNEEIQKREQARQRLRLIRDPHEYERYRRREENRRIEWEAEHGKL